MRLIQVFDPALCCSSGVCGADVDQNLVIFAGDAEWLKQQGGSLYRFNLAQQPLVFAETPAVSSFLELTGEEGLPVTLVDGQVVLTGRYPSRAELIRYAGLELPKAPESDGADVESQKLSPTKPGPSKGSSRVDAAPVAVVAAKHHRVVGKISVCFMASFFLIGVSHVPVSELLVSQ